VRLKGFCNHSSDSRDIRKMLEIDVSLSKRGEKLEFRDIAIGATAITEGLVLISGNVSHFERMKKYGLKFKSREAFIDELRRL